MSAAHTPGPWTVGTDETQFGVKRGNGMEPLGFVYCPAFAERSALGQEAIANARLIAAAPDLLAELIRLRDTLRRNGYATETTDAVIARATGEQA